MSIAGYPFYGSNLYLSHLEANAEFFDVPPWHTGVLARSIPGTSWRDAAGGYPLTCLERDVDIEGGLRLLQQAGFVTFVGVLDPTREIGNIVGVFPWRYAFKKHFLVRDPGTRFLPAAQHRRHIKRAREACVITVGRLAPWLQEWSRLYGETACSRGWSSRHRFSPRHQEDLAEAEEIVAFRADAGNELAAMGLFVRDGMRAYYHLGASTAAGYSVQASYGIIADAIAHFSNVAIVDLGGTAGTLENRADGLAQFKRGFANGEATAWLVGAVLNDRKYLSLSEGVKTAFFPAYRSADPNQGCGTNDVKRTGSRSTVTDASHSP